MGVISASISTMHDIVTVLSFLFVIERSSSSEYFNRVSKYKSACFWACFLQLNQAVTLAKSPGISMPENAIQQPSMLCEALTAK